VEDYGLSRARLIHTPLFSGLAAVGGVMLVMVLPALVNLSAITPEGAASASGGSMPPNVAPQLADIFQLNAISLLVAALFGLTPGLLIDRLHQAETYTANIKATAAPHQAADQERD
jgi:hypothetical protein